MKEIKLTNGYVALVDDEDFEYLNQWKWGAVKYAKTYYGKRNIIKDGRQTSVYMHRIILGIKDSKVLTDHRDMNGLNNQKQNLRTCNRIENGRNRKASKSSNSKYVGVCWQTGANKFTAQIHKEGKKIHLGCFRNEVDAAKAFNKAAKQIHGEFANLNDV